MTSSPLFFFIAGTVEWYQPLIKLWMQTGVREDALSALQPSQSSCDRGFPLELQYACSLFVILLTCCIV